MTVTHGGALPKAIVHDPNSGRLQRRFYHSAIGLVNEVLHFCCTHHGNYPDCHPSLGEACAGVVCLAKNTVRGWLFVMPTANAHEPALLTPDLLRLTLAWSSHVTS